jgi:hypothetical protein
VSDGCGARRRAVALLSHDLLYGTIAMPFSVLMSTEFESREPPSMQKSIGAETAGRRFGISLHNFELAPLLAPLSTRRGYEHQFQL